MFLNPTDPGLSYDELFEVAKRLEWRDGEIRDALPHVGNRIIGARRILPDNHTLASWNLFFGEDPEYRKFDAFDFVVAHLNDEVKDVGAANAQLDRKVVVERAVAKGISRKDIEVAVTYQVLSGTLVDTDRNPPIQI